MTSTATPVIDGIETLSFETAPVPPRQAWRVLAVLSALMLGFGSISTDLYLPAMPQMAGVLAVDSGSIELTISSLLIGFSLGQLIWAPIGDRYGRRIPVAVGLVLFAIGSAGCAMPDTISSLIVWRFVQALGACAGVAPSQAMVRDLYDGNRAAQMLSTLMTVMAIAPLLGPVIGGQILLFSGWRVIFWTLTAVGMVTFAALFTLPETLPANWRNRQTLRRAFLGYGSLLCNRRLLAYAGAGGFLYAGIFAYMAGTPFAYISYYQYSASASSV